MITRSKVDALCLVLMLEPAILGCRSSLLERPSQLASENQIRSIDLSQGSRLTYFGYNLQSVRSIEFLPNRNSILISTSNSSARQYEFSYASGETTYSELARPEFPHPVQNAKCTSFKTLGEGRYLCLTTWENHEDTFDLDVLASTPDHSYQRIQIDWGLKYNDSSVLHNSKGAVLLLSKKYGVPKLFSHENQYGSGTPLVKPSRIEDDFYGLALTDTTFYSMVMNKEDEMWHLSAHEIEGKYPSDVPIAFKDTSIAVCRSCRVNSLIIVSNERMLAIISDHKTARFTFAQINLSKYEMETISVFDQYPTMTQLSTNLIHLSISSNSVKTSEHYLFNAAGQHGELIKLDRAQMPHHRESGFSLDIKDPWNLLYTADPLGRGNDVYQLDLAGIFAQ